MSIFQQVSYQLFSKTDPRIFLKLCMKLESLKGKKLTEMNFSEKLSIQGKIPKIPPKQGSFWLSKKYQSIDISLFTLKMVHNNVLFDSVKTACQEKIWFFSYDLKHTQPIRLKPSLMINIYGSKQSQIFGLEIAISGREDLRLPLLSTCGQLSLLSNLIAGFFDHQYLCNESIDTLDFMH